MVAYASHGQTAQRMRKSAFSALWSKLIYRERCLIRYLLNSTSENLKNLPQSLADNRDKEYGLIFFILFHASGWVYCYLITIPYFSDNNAPVDTAKQIQE